MVVHATSILLNSTSICFNRRNPRIMVSISDCCEYISVWRCRQCKRGEGRHFEGLLPRYVGAPQVAQQLKKKINLHNAGAVGYVGSLTGLGRGGNGNPFQYSCLENSMDRGAWRAIVHRIAKSWTRVSNWACRRTFQVSPSLCLSASLNIWTCLLVLFPGTKHLITFSKVVVFSFGDEEIALSWFFPFHSSYASVDVLIAFTMSIVTIAIGKHENILLFWVLKGFWSRSPWVRTPTPFTHSQKN